MKKDREIKLKKIENYVKDKMKLFGNSEDIRGKAIMEVLQNIDAISKGII